MHESINCLIPTLCEKNPAKLELGENYLYTLEITLHKYCNKVCVTAIRTINYRCLTEIYRRDNNSLLAIQQIPISDQRAPIPRTTSPPADLVDFVPVFLQVLIGHFMISSSFIVFGDEMIVVSTL